MPCSGFSSLHPSCRLLPSTSYSNADDSSIIRPRTASETSAGRHAICSAFVLQGVTGILLIYLADDSHWRQVFPSKTQSKGGTS
ncbi:hypothetical protein OE88DRAFT_1657425 [Heliocybe sulcata]|uniref:Uncharacterized protein n=1 Tax=Heliocybe sulcata TaxID=5364 RepID=A0A5C3N5X9_9AGAM|nr:hypothetical protein OE88DRAFT_1657425 [Heliocybe sulcata]